MNTRALPIAAIMIVMAAAVTAAEHIPVDSGGVVIEALGGNRWHPAEQSPQPGEVLLTQRGDRPY